MPFTNNIQEIIDLVKSAFDQVPQEYYKLPTTYSECGIVRERIFCYELYHLLRKEQDRNTNSQSCSLHGEIDKSGHEEFASGDWKNPDFVFHVPGEMESNFVVVEVKGKIKPSDIKKDFKTLHRFTSFYEYKAGLFLLYNHSFNDLRQRMMDVDLSQFDHPEKMVILSKASSSAELELCNFDQLNSRTVSWHL